MENAVKGAAAAYVAPKVLKKVKLRWVIYAAAAYYGLRYLNKKGILPKQTGFALDKIHEGIDFAKQQVSNFAH